MHINDLEGNEQDQWAPIYYSGKVLLRADTGKFYALCVNCFKTAGQNNTAFVNAKSIGDSNLCNKDLVPYFCYGPSNHVYDKSAYKHKKAKDVAFVSFSVIFSGLV
jgi:hypothetical protein